MGRPLHHHLKHAFIPHEGNNHHPHALRSKALKVYATLLIGVKLFVMSIVAFYPGTSYVSNVTVQNIVALTNQARQSAGLAPLAVNGLLGQAAQGKANDMIVNQYFAHTSPANVTPWDWFKRAGYSYKFAGENLAKDFSTAETLVDAWLASPSHRKNIMNANYTEIGIAVSTGEVNGVQTIVVAQMFGAPLQVEVAAAPEPAPATSQSSSTPSIQQPSTPTTPSTPTPQPVVKAEPPITPTIAFPKPESLLNVAQPRVAGVTSPNAVVKVQDGETVVLEVKADAEGKYEGDVTEPLLDGSHSLIAYAVDPDSQLESGSTEPVTISIDTQSPLIALDRSVVLPSWEPRTGYDVFATVTNDPEHVVVRYGGIEANLQPSVDGYYGQIDTRGSAQADSAISVIAQDAAQNITEAPLITTEFFGRMVLEPSRLITPDTLIQIVLYSQRFFVAFLIFLTIALALMVFIRFRVQHHPTVVYSLLLMYTISILLIV
ncbi:MAG: hypothetical protein H6760_03985 [Candidatus Nomurabacteria bacterium]|nr:MAG: hypothetical protein H6760_03985 [Candidatus Nomurabacteria bacterium]